MKTEIFSKIPFEPLFFIINKKDGRGVAIEKEIENGYMGLVIGIDNSGINTSPFYIAKTFIENEWDKFDFTKDFDVILNHITQ